MLGYHFSSLSIVCAFWATVCNAVRPMLSVRCVSCLSVLCVLSVKLVYCGQTVGWIMMKLGTQLGLGPGHIVLGGDPAPLPKTQKGNNPRQFSASICCGQMAAWITMPLGMEVSLGPGDFVLDGDPAPPPKKGAESLPNFWPISIVAKRLDASRCHLVWK